MPLLTLMISDWPPEPWLEPLRKALPDHEVTCWTAESDPAGIDYALVWKPSPGALAALPDLKIIFSLGAGVDHILSDPDLPAVPIVRIVDADLTDRMSEYIVLHVLLHHRRVLDYQRLQREIDWTELPQPAAKEIRVGILGLGTLGLDATKKLEMLGFQVAGWSRTAKDTGGIDCFAGKNRLDAFLARTDILVCLLPLTPETTGILNSDLFRKLAKDGAGDGPVLINAGRGKLQVERDILDALDSGDLQAASLDVFEDEPLAPASPLWRHPRVVITPHIAAVSAPEPLAENIAGQIKSFEAGRSLTNLIDRKRGY